MRAHGSVRNSKFIYDLSSRASPLLTPGYCYTCSKRFCSKFKVHIRPIQPCFTLAYAWLLLYLLKRTVMGRGVEAQARVRLTCACPGRLLSSSELALEYELDLCRSARFAW